MWAGVSGEPKMLVMFMYYFPISDLLAFEHLFKTWLRDSSTDDIHLYLRFPSNTENMDNCDGNYNYTVLCSILDLQDEGLI